MKAAFQTVTVRALAHSFVRLVLQRVGKFLVITDHFFITNPLKKTACYSSISWLKTPRFATKVL